MSYGGGYSNQYTTTSYGGQGGEGGFTEGESSSQSKFANTSETRSLRPVTIKQLNDATQAFPDAPFKIDGVDIHQICFVGQVRSVSKLATHITFKLDDGTGEIEVRYFIPPDEKEAFDDEMEGMDMLGEKPVSGGAKRIPKAQQVTANGYAKVWAVLKTFNDRRSVNAQAIHPLTNINEYHCHFVEATAAHLYSKHGPPKTGQTVAGAGAGASSGAASDAASRTVQRMSPIARKFYETLRNTAQTNEGLHVNVLATSMHVNINEVYKAAEELFGLGVIFQTVDEETWALLDF
ncbi:replication factor A protein 2 [Myotisia sp. PD_48]|nr:replication factor A protein 2 [Myotisia sp. PD_48]